MLVFRWVSNLGAFLLLSGVLFSTALLAGPPMRLHIEVEKNTLVVGERTAVKVSLLDAGYKPTASDRKRLVQLTTGAADSVGHLKPPRVVIDSGATDAEVLFQAMRPGRVTIRATSAGLTPAQSLLSVFPPRRTSSAVLSIPVVHADSPLKVELAPKSMPPVPANNKTPAELHVLLDRILGPGETVLIRITASGPARITYKEHAETGSLDFQLHEGEAQSDDIHVSSAAPGRMVITAAALTGGSSDQVGIDFEAPRPDRILLQTDAEVAPPLTLAPLDIRLADQDGVPLTAASHDQEVVLSSDAAVQFAPDHLRLSASRPKAEAVVQWRDFPDAGVLTVLARDPNNALNTGKATIALKTRAAQVRLSGPSELARKGQGTLTVSLVDKANQPVPADRPRTILLSADRGEIAPIVVQMSRGERFKTVRYTSPKTSGPAALRADSDGLDAGILQVSIVIAAWMLLTFAVLGGLTGALARLVYKERVKCILPRWVNGAMEPGLMVNTVFGGFFGVLVFQAVLLGVLGPAGLREPGASVAGGPQTLAFFVGSIGGYAGLLSLDYLLARFFPGASEQRSAAAAAGGD